MKTIDENYINRHYDDREIADCPVHGRQFSFSDGKVGCEKCEQIRDEKE